ncbi:hypothetical protein NA8A_02345 [Nitratireductor indicus C115]|uniref:Uncharacterized protein n=1 Tax=Nitratireductor indicus C115 TaxID=1231190 RepID=K2NZ82_9HYPH|nr:hypothetical protein NA8A_02345 [Nitratireductor indicus C115]
MHAGRPCSLRKELPYWALCSVPSVIMLPIAVAMAGQCGGPLMREAGWPVQLNPRVPGKLGAGAEKIG